MKMKSVTRSLSIQRPTAKLNEGVAQSHIVMFVTSVVQLSFCSCCFQNPSHKPTRGLRKTTKTNPVPVQGLLYLLYICSAL